MSLAAWAAEHPALAWRALELAEARASLLAFCRLIEIPGAPQAEPDPQAADGDFLAVETPPAAHHQLLIEKLEAVARGEIRRLMVFMPPGSAKSTYASVVFPAWIMGRHPGRSIGVATYATDLAQRVGRKVRAIVRQGAFAEAFGAALAPGEAAAGRWALTTGGQFLGAGMLAGWTGNRLDGLIIDDPVKNREEADSATQQRKTRAEFDDSLKSRLKPKGFVVLIQTRWNEADLAGSILPEGWAGQSGAIACRDGLTWEVLSIPAEAEAGDPLGRPVGEMLWPEWFGRDPDFWTSARANARTWTALYQQRPQPETGTYFLKAWFDGGEAEGRVFPSARYAPHQLPAALRLYGASDFAVSEGRGDFTVHRVWGVDGAGDIWLLPGGYRAQATTARWIEALIDLMERHRPAFWLGEAGVIQKAVEPALLRRMKERGVACRLHWLPSIHGKTARARGVQGRAAMGKVRVPEGPEGDAVLDELIRFPAGRHDDEVDAFGLIGRALDLTHGATASASAPDGPVRGPGEITLDEALRRQEQGGRERL
jgi:predicted phage terminase large subunit-like protein